MKIVRFLTIAFSFATLFLLMPAMTQAQTADKVEDVLDRKENRADRRENKRDRRENKRDRREDVRDAQRNGAL